MLKVVAERRVLTDTVVADAAVRSARRPEDFTGVAVLQLDDLVVDLDVADPRRRSLASRDVHVGSLWKHSSQIRFNVVQLWS